MEEKRRAQRKQTKDFLGVCHRETEEFLGRLIDLSVKGMMIRAVQNMDAKSIYKFRIDLPTVVAGGQLLELDAECVWSSESTESGGRFDVGFKFTHLNFEVVKTIKYLLNDALFNDSKVQSRLTLAKKST